MRRTHDLIVVGAGSAGLTIAGGAGQLGLKVALIERGRMGGECLNTGCVPSKALIAAARRAQDMRKAGEVGVTAVEPVIDFARVRAHVQAAIATIAPHDSQARFEAWGVEVIRGEARFTGCDSLEVDGRRLSAARIVLATGSRPNVPAISGLAATPFLTNETLFDIDDLPRRLIVLGGGPLGLEMAQAFRRLGSDVTVVESGHPLARDDEEAAGLVVARLRSEGVEIRAGAAVVSAQAFEGGVRLTLQGGETVEGDHLLVATGRTAQVDGLGLEAVGVAVGEGGVRVDTRRRTSNPRIFAIGDCREGPRFTHAAGYEGALLVRTLGLGLPGEVDYRALPCVTYTDPELAQVGLTQTQAEQRFGKIQVVRQTFGDNDRAVVESRSEGFLKLVRARGRVVGATIVGDGAGDLAATWAAAIGGGGSPWALSGMILPYPTRGEISKAAAFDLYAPMVFGRGARAWARLVAALRR